MSRKVWFATLGLGLIAASALLYSLHYLLFHDLHHIFIYMVGDIAFVPIEVLLVTLILHRLLEQREKQAMLKKLNMPIGLFFSELGNEMLATMATKDVERHALKDAMELAVDTPASTFERLKEQMQTYQPKLELQLQDFEALRSLLSAKRGFLLQLFSNPNLLEHETFTDMLWAIFHLTEELESRQDFSNLPESDLDHLQGDVERAYERAMREWVDYMAHLKQTYPFLFSFAVRTNPFSDSG